MTRPQILVVEDERIDAENIQNMLNNLGYGVSGLVSSGKSAIKKAEETHPDLILMDIKLKGEMDGVEAAEKIRERFDIPVVYLTAYADDKTLQRAKITEPFGYILKPFEEKELHSTIEMALYKNKMERELKEREHWVSTVLKSIGDAVIATDKDGLVTFMNSSAEALTGWKHEEALGKDLGEKLNIVIEEEACPPSKSPKKKKGRKEVIRLSNQALLIKKEGIEIPVDYSHSALTDGKEDILGSVLVFRDITERKRAEEELQRSFKKVKKILEEIIHAISLVVEMRDPYTAGHQRRVANFSCAIAKELGLPKEQIDGIHMAGIIHDIGKIYVPGEILSKPARLNEAELSLVKNHPRVGYDILKKIEFPWPIAEIVLQHHERIDGSGYPQGLSGEEILLEARILGVADVIEAMSSHRPYRPSLGLDWAFQEISENRGVLYDPEVVDTCLRLFREKRFKFE